MTVFGNSRSQSWLSQKLILNFITSKHLQSKPWCPITLLA